VIAPFLLAGALASAAPATVDLDGSRLYIQADAGAQVVGMQLVVDAGTSREVASQSGLAALSAEVILHTNVDGVALADRVAAAGGSITFNVAPNVVRFTVDALPAALPDISRDLAAAFAAPDTSEAAIASARAELGSRIESEEKDPLFVGLEMLHQSYYTGGAALPALGTPASLAALRGSDVAAFITAHYLRGNAFATATGHIDATVSDAARTALAGLRDGTEADSAIVVDPPAAIGKQIVTRRDVAAPLFVIGFAAPALGDRDFAAMLVLAEMLRNVAPHNSATVFSSVESSVALVYEYDVKPATFTLAFNGGRIDPSSGMRAIENLVRRAAAQPLGADDLVRFRAQARGQWLLGGVQLTDRAWQIGAAVANGAEPDLESAVAAQVSQVTPDDVQRVARIYLQSYNVAIVLPRKPGNGS
jgi:predicted Zn-dependent peptidase